jgi:aminopeptidase
VDDLLFDEKMTGSLHVACGNAYDDADNGNRSAIHWDLVLRQTAAAGGGTLRFDGRLVREDGLFVLPELQALNPGAKA